MAAAFEVKRYEMARGGARQEPLARPGQALPGLARLRSFSKLLMVCQSVCVVLSTPTEWLAVHYGKGDTAGCTPTPQIEN
jgi:hypothetical protein